MHVPMFPYYVLLTARVENGMGTLRHKVKNRQYCHCPGLVCLQLPECADSWPSQGRGCG